MVPSVKPWFFADDAWWELALAEDVDSLLESGATPTGPAGGDLTGTYPNPSIATDAVTAAKIAANAVGSSEIAADAVGSSELADNAVDTNAIQDDAVTAAKIAAGAVGASELASTAVTPATYGDGTHVGQFTVDADGRLTAASSVAITATGGSVATDAIFDARGDLPVGTGADTAAKLTVGSNDQVLIADSSQTTGIRWGGIDGGGA